MRPPFGITLPERLLPTYTRARILVYALVILIAGSFLLNVLFPTFRFSFDFRNPGAARNNLFDPRVADGVSAETGRLAKESELIANFSALGNFSRASVTAELEKDSDLPAQAEGELRRGYQAFFYPLGDPLTDFPTADLYRIDETYFELRDGTLYPFVSAAAYLSRFSENVAQERPATFRDQYPVSETWLGYRVGMLLSFADGVFVVVSEEEVRPIGSAEIFLGLGYRFEDVLPVSEEEVGIYRRGRIFLLGAPHPDGTLFEDQDTNHYFIVENAQLRPLPTSPYRDFLLAQTAPIQASSTASVKRVGCLLVPGFFGQRLFCETELGALGASLGNDYELRIKGADTAVEFQTLSVALDTDKTQKNLRELLARMKQRLFVRFGAAP